MHAYSVGRLYHSGRRSWPEITQYSFRGGEHELVLFWQSPSHSEVDAVRRGRMDLEVWVEPPLILLLYKVEGACGWSDAPFAWHRVEASEQVLPELPGEGETALLHVVLVDAGTGIVRAMRQISFPPETAAELHQAVRDQAAAPWDPEVHDAALGRLYRSASAEDLANRKRHPS